MRVTQFNPTNTIEAAQFSIAPFQKKALRLDSIDRSMGELQPSWQGCSLYIEQTDYPFLFSLITQEGAIESITHIAHAGYQIEGLFKGIFVYHPLLTPSTANQLSCRVVIGVSRGDAYVNNQFAYPVHQGLMPLSVSINNATAFTANLYLPPGTKHCNDITIGLTAITVTGATISINGYYLGGLLASPTILNVPPLGLNYTTPAPAYYYLDIIPTPGAGAVNQQFKCRELNIPIGTQATNISIAITGTGFSSVMSDKSVKAMLA